MDLNAKLLEESKYIQPDESELKKGAKRFIDAQKTSVASPSNLTPKKSKRVSDTTTSTGGPKAEISVNKILRYDVNPSLSKPSDIKQS